MKTNEVVVSKNALEEVFYLTELSFCDGESLVDAVQHPKAEIGSECITITEVYGKFKLGFDAILVQKRFP